MEKQISIDFENKHTAHQSYNTMMKKRLYNMEGLIFTYKY
jgi:hypothetical protein